MSDITPRNYKPGGDVLEHTYAVMLEKHPESFDVLVYPAKESLENEINALHAPEITLLDRDERLQSFGEPYQARARIVPMESVVFAPTDSALYEAFSSGDAITLMLSTPSVRTFSVIQWKEYQTLKGTETVTRTVYVGAVKQVTRSSGIIQTLHVCFPLLAQLALPAVQDDKPVEESTGDIGVL
ncbi:MAG: hypothetical protein IJU76_14335 [Desulfovibrionaceae bacterium]|nr:hypothetical protein [Desulfovibrionaceae bacterium]